ncbi:MAG: hypothetical protein SWO11_21435 [Thermodesulfobacteriota bacterium]|nr:hypothetical protein [Thermodesulfobacteriota bacterium]
MIERIKKLLFLTLTFIIGWFFLSPVQNIPGYEEEGRKSNGNKMVTMDFDNVDIKVIARYISELTDKNFIVDDNVRGRGTIFCPTKIPVDEALKVFESLLEVNGYTKVEAGNSLKIIRLRHAKTKAVKARIGKDFITIDREDKIVTQVVPLKYADANEIKKLFRPLVSRRSHIGAYPATNTLICLEHPPSHEDHRGDRCGRFNGNDKGNTVGICIG